MYGVWGGALTSEIGAVIGAMVAFAATRYSFRSRLAPLLSSSSNFAAFTAAVDSHGFLVISLLRCAPVPFGLQNGAFALSNVTFSRYTAATIVGLIPEQLLFAYFGSTLKSLADVAQGHDALSPAQTYALYAQIALAGVIFFVIARVGKRALRSARAKASSQALQDVNFDSHASWHSHRDDDLGEEEHLLLPDIVSGDGGNLLLRSTGLDAGNGDGDSGFDSPRAGEPGWRTGNPPLVRSPLVAGPKVKV